MKKLILFAAAVFATAILHAQLHPKQPIGKPNQLPTPHIQQLKPADLQVTDIHLVSTEVRNKVAYIRVNVTIRNSGQLDAGASKMGSYFQSTTAASGAGWTLVPETVPVASIQPGQAISREYVFKIPHANLGTNRFNFRVKADIGNAISEIDENNNMSNGILIGL